MDSSFFLFGTITPLICALLTLAIKKEAALLFGFVGGLLGILTALGANSDGSITVAYNSSQTMGLWPALYFPILFAIMAWGICVIKAGDKFHL